MQDLGSVMKKNRGAKRSEIVAMKRKLERMFLSGDQRIRVAYMVQKRPYTYVGLSLRAGKGVLNGHGFAKAQHPDEWSDTRGIAIASNYAINDLVEDLLYNGVENRKTLDLIIG